ncbi:MAG: tRNA 4-thiouridine(8) synthase ThiI [Clostridiales bacterium]|nr:tRNA 4-thiouridine(8) synthase ThiI [Clostridiales bacterium]
MAEVILAKYGEIALKGLNKSTFENILMKNIRRRLRGLGKFSISKAQSTIYIESENEESDLDEAYLMMKKVFGISTLSKATVTEKDYDAIVAETMRYFDDELSFARTFKVEAKRADKSFPMKSPEICRELGAKILEAFPHLKVDVKKPEIIITVEIRDTNAYIHSKKESGAGGLPVGTSGRAMLLLSGGIDSPVAGYMMAKRGLVISAIHFISPPYTSERARMKVEQLCKKITDYCGDINFYCVPFTEIQETIRKECPEEYFTIIMRRLMVEIAQRVAGRDGSMALITGESVGQVASQTIEALVCTDAVCKMPVFRPVIGMDKTEIVDISRKIDTFEISIQPYEDCCTVFTPKHPKVRPTLEEIEVAENRVDFDEMVTKSIQETQKVTIRVDGC